VICVFGRALLREDPRYGEVPRSGPVDGLFASPFIDEWLRDGHLARFMADAGYFTGKTARVVRRGT